jgi:uncharacterized membrane protein
MIQSAIRYFVQGLLLTAPIVITLAVMRWVVMRVDGFLGLAVPGAGIVVAFSLVTAVGYLSSNVIGRRAFAMLEHAFGKMPVVKILYGSLRDLLEAFVGEKKRFDRPVLVDLDGRGALHALGFLTSEAALDQSLEGLVSVYLPQSYNFAGNLLLVPRERVRPVDVDSAELMSFVMSGGVTALHHHDEA